jgi:hypothetical protein
MLLAEAALPTIPRTGVHSNLRSTRTGGSSVVDELQGDRLAAHADPDTAALAVMD